MKRRYHLPTSVAWQADLPADERARVERVILQAIEQAVNRSTLRGSIVDHAAPPAALNFRDVFQHARSHPQTGTYALPSYDKKGEPEDVVMFGDNEIVGAHDQVSEKAPRFQDALVLASLGDHHAQVTGTVGPASDIYEQEAERVSEQIVGMREPHVQRQEPGPLQTTRAASSEVEQTAVPPTVHDVLGAAGQPLDTAARAFMEPRFGRDFSGVRVHTGPTAEQSARDLNADAYTVGHHLVFAPGQFAPGTHEGQRLLAHELTHVAQQDGGMTLVQRSPAGDRRWSRDENAARYRGQLLAKRIMNHGLLSKEARAKFIEELAYFEGSAYEVYLNEVRPALVAVTEIEMPAMQMTAPPAKTESSSHDKGDDKLLSHDFEYQDPRKSPRYIDTLFQNVTYSGFNGASEFHWQEGGKEHTVGIPLTALDQDDTRTFFPIPEVHNTKNEALKTVAEWASTPSSYTFYTFYRTSDNVIMPTSFSIHSAPEFHKLWPGLKSGVAEKAEEISGVLVPVANTINPIPGTKVDEYGNLSLSSNPLDWLALLKLRRLAKIREAGPITRRLHSGYDVPYSILGPHEKLSGTSVYVLKDAEGTVLYVGKGEAMNRLREHIKDPKKTQWFGEIARVEVWATGLNNTQALALEETLIGQLEPHYNVDKRPFHKEFGDSLAVSPNLPAAQSILKFWLEWGH